MTEEHRRKERERRAATRALYIAVYGSTRLLRGPERRPYNARRRARRRATEKTTAAQSMAPIQPST